ncbi:MAG: ribonuclease III [Actinobacteria bacterium]|nr:MAG: ribonuclease III [Actinomycetota bacterium]REK40738.1 MAG: ribonuclease III [Actinomycetota bacterium]
MTLQDVIGYAFKDQALLELALTHRSVSSENPSRFDNERLEFLGDAVLQLVVTDRLYADFPDLPEGQMAKVRAAVVSGSALAEIATSIGLGDHVELSPSEERSGGRTKRSILADALEAIIGAVYLDSGFAEAETLVHRLWEGRIEEKAANPGVRDYKTRLQEVLAVTGRRPEYEVTGTGPDHKREFSAVVSVDGSVLGVGEGRSKKAAEQAAAETALRSIS